MYGGEEGEECQDVSDVDWNERKSNLYGAEVPLFVNKSE